LLVDQLIMERSRVQPPGRVMENLEAEEIAASRRTALDRQSARPNSTRPPSAPNSHTQHHHSRRASDP
jgi:hypothetical protein